jgi:DNA-nicking Smr family endonuclease
VDNPNENPPGAIEVPIVDRLDLHHFRPKDVASVVREYLIEAQALGLPEVLLIHGKGRGVLRRTVHSVLRTHPCVASFHLAGERAGQWGATVALLRDAEEASSPSSGSSE